jgi:hypothetical protein
MQFFNMLFAWQLVLFGQLATFQTARGKIIKWKMETRERRHKKSLKSDRQFVKFESVNAMNYFRNSLIH